VARKRELIIGVAILIIATLAFLFGWTNVFTVKSVGVSGSPDSQITKQVLQISDIQVGDKLARIEPRNIASKLSLAGIDWIKDVKVSRNWLSRKVTIDLTPRIAVAVSGDKYVDGQGVLFTSPVNINKKLALITAKSSATRAAAIELYLNLPKELKDKVTAISASASENFQLVLDQKLRINWGSNSNTAVKIKIYKALITLPENKKISQMDLSDPTKPTVK
jgi:cell division septal protein FtsQ